MVRSSLWARRAGGLLFLLLLFAALLLLPQPALAEEGETGWSYRDGQWYYISEDGSAAVGWLKSGDCWYWFDENGVMATGMRQIGLKSYFFDTDTGAMTTGWVEWDGSWHYFLEDGSAAVGWYRPNHTWYFFGPTGYMRFGWFRYGGNWYFLDPETGAMTTGWVEWNDAWYHMADDGTLETGWIKPSNTWYYVLSDGSMQHGWMRYNDAWYYFDPETGAMATGWKYDTEGENWYHFTSSGVMECGWKYINGDYYYLNAGWYEGEGPFGAMAHDVTYNDWELQSDGRLVDGPQIYMEEQAYGCSSSTDYLLVVDTTACVTGVFYGSRGNWDLWYFWDCAPGAASSPTVKGSYTVQAKGYYFDSGIYRCYYYTQFYGNYLFHSVLYDHYGNLADGRVGMNLSHGCVRLPIDYAYWIYSNIPQGTKVYIY